MKRLILLSTILLSTNAYAFLPNHCGALKNHYGPFDYTNQSDVSIKLPIVEAHHFTGKVERLVAGESGGLTNDLDYTLKTFPNHHRALYAMMRWQLKQAVPITEYTQSKTLLTMDCYFLRALFLKYNDPNTLMLYGMYEYKLGNIDQAIAHYDTALKISPNFSQLHYNIGLAYFNKKDYEKSQYHANISYELGFPLGGLKRKLNTLKK